MNFEDAIIRMAIAHDKKIVEHLESENGWTKGHLQWELSNQRLIYDKPVYSRDIFIQDY
jgi:hypothetical protein